ncbi:RNA polymerase sigma factor [Vulgatibacter incomptus]|uniref:RNA polymerase sigma-70 region 2 domain-containing protein n=1 Tax=Vulgatibacter incomptus TaxID=1391653 RepID=A0A0K1PGP0_9BACT|nr:RNA polymerase sigma factor [Vulgatibacter incomptus]AKU92269.1 hypothetical protein AKJ08_2656 [Vulgatibacter incomptus]
MSTDDLIERCARRDEAAWSTLLADHRSVVVRIIGRIVGDSDPSSVADLEQEVYVRLLANDCDALRRLRDPGALSLRAFVCTTAANVARDHLRRKRVRKVVSHVDWGDLEDEPVDPGLGADERVGLWQGAARVSEALRRAVREPNAARDSLIFKAHYVEGLTAPEIEAMGVGLSTKGVETVLFRLTAKVRNLLRGDDGEIS